MLPSLDDETQAHAEQRLHDETIIWLTTVRADGQPQTSPVGFVWDGTSFLILTNPDTAKVRNLQDNPRVALHLDIATGDEGNGVLTIEGVATLDPEPLDEGETARYLARYLATIHEVGMTPEEVFAELSGVIRVRPNRARQY